jgi:UPF0755 protein
MKKISRRQIKNIKDWAKFALAVGCVVVFVLFYVFSLWSPVKKTVTVVVNRGSSVLGMANYLYVNDIIYSKHLFYLSVRLNGGKIQAGEYDIPRGAGAWTIASMFANGKVATTTITIPEGYTIKQTKKMLRETTSLSGDVDCNKSIPVCKLQEGYIFPDTYRVARGTPRLAVLDLARKKMDSIKQSLSSNKYPTPLKNWNDVLVLASIVQKETPKEREMPIVAGVYLNRLRSNMRLQADPTVVYALTKGEGDMHGAPLLSGHLKLVSPYNTYMNNGLPPKPIANPGREAIHAVLKPAKTNYLYFVADGRGGHKFSKTYEEHQKNHEEWRVIKKKLNK